MARGGRSKRVSTHQHGETGEVADHVGRELEPDAAPACGAKLASYGCSCFRDPNHRGLHRCTCGRTWPQRRATGKGVS